MVRTTNATCMLEARLYSTGNGLIAAYTRCRCNQLPKHCTLPVTSDKTRANSNADRCPLIKKYSGQCLEYADWGTTTSNKPASSDDHAYADGLIERERGKQQQRQEKTGHEFVTATCDATRRRNPSNEFVQCESTSSEWHDEGASSLCCLL